ncbi:hypothetical protein [Alienimonas californiensis]|uniref:Uncharacterized protein n=1 Tax=Alienimonas californiensis TaxID=2527989 RepID=A0A517PBM3_9PLAN|nr:hypothetical protein [Alienimonas californiensis]QDT16761.1 hypothetical protein CA12_28680 [Alienimonas californiensis]
MHLRLIAFTVGRSVLPVQTTVFLLKSVAVSGFELELLEPGRARQVEQEHVLLNLATALPLLLATAERQHLLSLDHGKSGWCRGGGLLRTALRRRYSIRLLAMAGPNRQVGHSCGNRESGLGDLVRLTLLGVPLREQTLGNW